MLSVQRGGPGRPGGSRGVGGPPRAAACHAVCSGVAGGPAGPGAQQTWSRLQSTRGHRQTPGGSGIRGPAGPAGPATPDRQACRRRTPPPHPAWPRRALRGSGEMCHRDGLRSPNNLGASPARSAAAARPRPARETLFVNNPLTHQPRTSRGRRSRGRTGLITDQYGCFSASARLGQPRPAWANPPPPPRIATPCHCVCLRPRTSPARPAPDRRAWRALDLASADKD